MRGGESTVGCRCAPDASLGVRLLLARHRFEIICLLPSGAQRHEEALVSSIRAAAALLERAPWCGSLFCSTMSTSRRTKCRSGLSWAAAVSLRIWVNSVRG